MARRTKEDAAETRSRLLGAAERLFSEKGVSRTSLNDIAVAAGAKGDTTLLVLGLAISIPLVIFGSTLIIKIMDRFPWIVTLGAALIGWVAGETIVSDHVLQDFVQNYPWVKYLASAVGAVLVIAWGMLMQQRIAAKSANA